MVEYAPLQFFHYYEIRGKEKNPAKLGGLGVCRGWGGPQVGGLNEGWGGGGGTPLHTMVTVVCVRVRWAAIFALDIDVFFRRFLLILWKIRPKIGPQLGWR